MRLSVTDVDAIMAWIDSDSDIDALLRRLRREEPPTRAMMAGRAFHKVMENASGDLETAIADGFSFRFAIESEIAIPPIRELKGEIEISTSIMPVTLVGVVDGMKGKVVTDYKLTSYFDAERYINSFQWKAYLTMFKADRFNYEVFTMSDDGEIVIKSHDTLPLCRYESMHREVFDCVEEAARFVSIYLPEKLIKGKEPHKWQA